MKSTYTISIPKPCHENWQEMTVVEKGKFCNSCQKNVHDFTNSSDKQIIDAFKIDKNLCGRFLDSQLERDVIENKEKSTVWFATTSVILSFLAFGSENVFSQEKAKTEQTELKTVENITNIENNSEEKVITGIVSDEGGPMPGVNVLVVRTKKGVSTNFDGSFTINANVNDILKFSFMGMPDYSQTINQSNFYKIKMIYDPNIKQTFVTVGSICWKRKTFLGRTFVKIKNWFR